MGNVVLDAVLYDLNVYIERAKERVEKAESEKQRAYWNGYIHAMRDAKTDLTLLLWSDDE